MDAAAVRPSSETASGAQIPHILIVDDGDQNRAVLSGHIEILGYTSEEAVNGADALDHLQERKPDLILLDLNMPVMDGQELLAIIVADKELSTIPVVIISGNDDQKIISECIQMGAEDYMVKPFQPRILRARIENCLAKRRAQQQERLMRENAEADNRELEKRVAAQVRQLAEAQHSTIFALSTLAESRDPETGAHLDRMRNYCWVLGEELARTDKYHDAVSPAYIELLYTTSPLHDIGKVGIPDHVLLKPGKLTDEEFEIMKDHCVIGARTLQKLIEKFPENDFLAMGFEIAQHHHEKWNGRGYPAGIAGEAIPLSARILAVCDVYDALTSKRCYKDAMSHDDSAAIILKEAGEHFDPDIVEAFDRCQNRFREICATYQD